MSEPIVRLPTSLKAVALQGFKLFSNVVKVEFAPLTVLAGANSTGKSSILQPLLLMKQTLEADYDPGALKVDGPLLSYSSFRQFLSQRGDSQESSMQVEIEIGSASLLTEFLWAPGVGLSVDRITFEKDGQRDMLLRNSSDEAMRNSSPIIRGMVEELQRNQDGQIIGLMVVPYRFFLGIQYLRYGAFHIAPKFIFGEEIGEALRSLVYIPALRKRERLWPNASVVSHLPGVFEYYLGSLLHAMTEEEMTVMNDQLRELGLTRKVKTVNRDVHIEIQVDRFPATSSAAEEDFVNLVDVGVGVSQILPVLVALLVARPGWTVYIEEPEIHLHPRAQVVLAGIFAAASKRGVTVIIETHSALLLRSIQTLVAKKALAPEDVALHWFTRSSDGTSQVTRARLDEEGAVGDWPEDFTEVILDTEQAYFEASYG